jgi:hypothetical protein
MPETSEWINGAALERLGLSDRVAQMVNLGWCEFAPMTCQVRLTDKGRAEGFQKVADELQAAIAAEESQ